MYSDRPSLKAKAFPYTHFKFVIQLFKKLCLFSDFLIRQFKIIKKLGSGELPGKILLVRVIKNDKIDAFF